MRPNSKSGGTESIRCAKCGQINGAGASYCEACGAGLCETCPECRTELSAGKVYCPFCGAEIEPTRRYFAHVATGKEHLDESRYSQAVQEFERALALRPQDNELRDLMLETADKRDRLADLMNRAKSAYDLHHYEESEGIFREALELDPHSEEIQQCLSSIPERIREDELQELLSHLQNLFDDDQVEDACELAETGYARLGDERLKGFAEKARTELRRQRIEGGLEAARAAHGGHKFSLALQRLSDVLEEDSENLEAQQLQVKVARSRHEWRERFWRRFGILCLGILAAGLVTLGTITLVRRHQAAATEKNMFLRTQRGLVPAYYLMTYPRGRFVEEAELLVDSLDDVWKKSKIYDVKDSSLVQEAMLTYAWQALLKEHPISAHPLPIPTVIREKGTLGMKSERDGVAPERREVYVESVGDPDRDGFVEGTVGWTHSYGVYRGRRPWGVVEFTPSGPRRDDWSVIDSSLSKWIETKFAGRDRIVPHAYTIKGREIWAALGVFCSDDPECCPRFQVDIAFAFTRYSRAKVINAEVKTLDAYGAYALCTEIEPACPIPEAPAPPRSPSADSGNEAATKTVALQGDANARDSDTRVREASLSSGEITQELQAYVESIRFHVAAHEYDRPIYPGVLEVGPITVESVDGFSGIVRGNIAACSYDSIEVHNKSEYYTERVEVAGRKTYMRDPKTGELIVNPLDADNWRSVGRVRDVKEAIHHAISYRPTFVVIETMFGESVPCRVDSSGRFCGVMHFTRDFCLGRAKYFPKPGTLSEESSANVPVGFAVYDTLDYLRFVAYGPIDVDVPYYRGAHYRIACPEDTVTIPMRRLDASAEALARIKGLKETLKARVFLNVQDKDTRLPVRADIVVSGVEVPTMDILRSRVDGFMSGCMRSSPRAERCFEMGSNVLWGGDHDEIGNADEVEFYGIAGGRYKVEIRCGSHYYFEGTVQAKEGTPTHCTVLMVRLANNVVVQDGNAMKGTMVIEP